MATRRSVRNSTGARRKRVWARNDEVLAGVGAAGEVFDLAADYITLAGTNHLPVGITVRGIMLDLGIEVTTAGTSPTAGVTIGVIALDQNVAADVPLPELQPHVDWMWYEFIHTGTSAIGTRYSTFDANGGPLRLGAQRKVEELGTHLWFCVQTSGAGLAVDLRVKSSVLMLLP